MYSMISMHISYLTKGSHILLQICTSTFKHTNTLDLGPAQPRIAPRFAPRRIHSRCPSCRYILWRITPTAGRSGLPIGSLLVNIDKPGIKGPNQQNSVSQSRNALSAVQYRTYIGCLDGIGTWMDGIWMEFGWNMNGIWMEYEWIDVCEDHA